MGLLRYGMKKVKRYSHSRENLRRHAEDKSMYSVRVCNQQSILEKQKHANRAQFSHRRKTAANDQKQKIVVTYIVSNQTGSQPNHVGPH